MSVARRCRRERKNEEEDEEEKEAEEEEIGGLQPAPSTRVHFSLSSTPAPRAEFT